MEKEIAIVYMVAGISSRFGGKVKQLIKVTDEHTLIEYSLKQALKAGFTKIIFIVGEKTEQHFKEMFGSQYKGIPVQYVFQTYDKEKRDRPWGTAETLTRLKEIEINHPFVLCNGDDLYGENTFKILVDHLKESPETAAIGYKLEDVMPDQGTVNRAIFKTDQDNYLTNLIENLNIEKNNLPPHLDLNNLCSMNIFALHPETVNHFHERFVVFQEQNKNDRRIEFLLPDIVGELVKEKKIKMKVYPTSDIWIGVTNPEDEEIVRKIVTELEEENETTDK